MGKKMANANELNSIVFLLLHAEQAPLSIFKNYLPIKLYEKYSILSFADLVPSRWFDVHLNKSAS